MFDAEKLMDRLHYNGERHYDRVEGEIAYLDGTGLDKPVDMPKAQVVILGVIVAIAIIIGIFILKDTVIAGMVSSLTAEQTIEENLQREASIKTIPKISDLIGLDDATIRATFEQEGYIIYDASSLNDNGNMTLYKLPSDMTLDEALVLYGRGMNGLNVQEATKLLNGSWSFSVDRVNTTSMVVRYADFTTGDPQVAIQNALAAEEFDSATVTESGVDDSQNTFTMGTLEAGGVPCTWKISALPLDEMYSVSGLPKDACYVGVRLTVR